MPAVARPWKEWIRNRGDELAVEEGCFFDLAAAERVQRFFRQFLRHSKGAFAGKPFELLQWQFNDVIAPVFGWKRRDGLRRFRRAYVEIPKKNGKSTLGSGVGLYLLAGDGEAGAQIFSTGADKDQASIVHGEAINMVEASPELSRHLTINQTTRNITYIKARSFYRALSAVANTKEGLDAHGLIGDELHAWYGRKLYDCLKYAGAGRRQPLQFNITTAGDDMQSVCREEHDHGKQVLKGEVKDTRQFAYIRSADQEDDCMDPKIWHKANPSLGDTINLEDFAADAAAANGSASKWSAFKRYRLNVWATATNPWLNEDHWKKCARKYTLEDLRGMPCRAGLDLSSTDDMTALALVFQLAPEKYRLWVEFWMPHDTVHDKDRPHYLRDWAEKGLIHVTPGNVIDYEFIQERLRAIIETAGVIIEEDTYDPIYAEKFTQELENELGIPRVKFAQSMMNFAGPTKEFERLVMAGLLEHPDHPVLNWMAGHVQVLTDANMNMRPVKPKKWDRRKIDGIVASIMGLGRWLTGETTASVYDQEDKELIVL